MTTYGAKISQTGYDVNTAELKRLVYTSEYDTLKVAATGSGSIAVAASASFFTVAQATTNIAHGLGFAPAFFVFADNPAWSVTNVFAPRTYRSIGGGFVEVVSSVDTTNLYITAVNQNPSSGYTFNYRYIILYNKLI